MFPADKSLSELNKAINDGDYKAAFIAAHTLKGVSLNLGLTPISEISSDITEILRSGNCADSITPLLKKLNNACNDAIDLINSSSLK